MARDKNDQEQKRGVAPEGLRPDQHQEEQERLPPRIGALKPEDEERAVKGNSEEPPARRSPDSD
jgi:hypothetical protein